MVTVHSWRLDGHGTQAYERHLVPAILAPLADRLLELAQVRPAERVLDVACGTGVVARRAAGMVGPAGTVVGIDANEEMLAVASALSADAPIAIGWRTAEAASLDSPDEAFDVVCCQQGLQFFPDRAAAISEMHRVLVPGGRLALAVWRQIEYNAAYPSLMVTLERHVGPAAASIVRAPFSGPDRAELRDLLTAAGFGEITCRIAVIPVRFSSPSEFLRQSVLGSPLAGPVRDLGPDRLEALVEDLNRALAPLTDDDGTAFAVQSWLAIARRPDE